MVLTLLVAVVVVVVMRVLTYAWSRGRRARHGHRVKRGFVPPAALHRTTLLPNEESPDDQTGNTDGK
jgi:hypothetical protein